MYIDRELIEKLAQLRPIKWQGVVYRHMFKVYPPDRENTIGARWNPPQTPAIYTSLESETA